MKGEVVSHFRIHERIGRGGMGEVYRAEDTRLGREVALKFLPPEIAPDERKRRRFFREARAASALDHPNICTIYEVDETEDGQIFLAMALYRGTTLRERIESGSLGTAEAVDTALQLIRGLERAHEHGIVHRDLKPSNVFVTEDGLVKLLDFGLAKLSDGSRVTRSGTAVGTIGYMAPEQVLAQDVDHRADLWSFGVMLYEMLTGRLPFTADSEASTLYAVVHSEPSDLREVRPELPDELHRVVERCLAKDPVERYGAASAVRRDLERLQSKVQSEDVLPTQGWLRPMPTTGSKRRSTGLSHLRPWWRRLGPWRIAVAALLAATLGAAFWLLAREAPDAATVRFAAPRSLAVLPLENLTGRADLEYLPQGVGAVLVGQLARLPGVHVVARDEVWSIRRKHPSASAREVARELGVDAILEGQFLSVGDRSQVHLSLVEAATGFVAWSRTVEAPSGGLLELQSELASEVAQRLATTSSGLGEAAVAPGTQSEEAYAFFVRGEALWTREPSDVDGAVELLRQAVTVDPSFALAHATLGLALVGQGSAGEPSALDEALLHAERALALDPAMPEALLARAEVWEGRGRTEEAIAELERLVALYPELDRASNQLARAYRRDGRLSEAERTVRQALRRRPEYWRLWNTLGGLMLRQGAYQDAREAFKKAASLTELEYGTPYENLATLELMQGNFQAALDAFERLPQPIEDAEVASNLGTTYFYLGDMDEAARYYRTALRLRPSSPFHANLGDVYDRQGNAEAARREYGRAADMLAGDGVAPPSREDALARTMYLAKAGRCDEALDRGARLEQEVTLAAQSATTLAKAHAACGARDGALHLLERALELGYRPELARDEVEFADLVSDRRFVALLERFAGE